MPVPLAQRCSLMLREGCVAVRVYSQRPGDKSSHLHLCLFLWCKFFHSGQFQAARGRSANRTMGNDRHARLQVPWREIQGRAQGLSP